MGFNLGHLGRAGITFLILAVCACSTPPAPGNHAELDVPFISQENLLCVPTSASMVLTFYNDPVSSREIKSLASGRKQHPGEVFSDFSITQFSDLLRGLRTMGYAWEEVSLSDSHADFERGISKIEESLALGRPVLVDLSIPSGHTVVIRGYNSKLGLLSIVDPSQPSPGRFDITYQQFEAVWNEHAYGHQTRGMILTKPKNAT